jgi:NADPH-dependent curcumin reductase CurA
VAAADADGEAVAGPGPAVARVVTAAPGLAGAIRVSIAALDPVRVIAMTGAGIRCSIARDTQP